jgi:hypothetical protein
MNEDEFEDEESEEVDYSSLYAPDIDDCYYHSYE